MIRSFPESPSLVDRLALVALAEAVEAAFRFPAGEGFLRPALAVAEEALSGFFFFMVSALKSDEARKTGSD